MATDISCALPFIVKKCLVKSLYGLHEITFDTELFNKFYVNKLKAENECTEKFYINSKCLQLSSCDNPIEGSCDLDVEFFYNVYYLPDPGIFVMDFYVIPFNNTGETHFTVTQDSPHIFVQTGTNTYSDLPKAYLIYGKENGDINVTITVRDESCVKIKKFFIPEYRDCGDTVPDIKYTILGDKIIVSASGLPPGGDYTYTWVVGNFNEDGTINTTICTIDNQDEGNPVTHAESFIGTIHSDEPFIIFLLVYNNNTHCTYDSVTKMINDESSS